MIDAIRRTLEHELSANPRMVVFGEDVGRKGGVQGATRDLQARFGAERVFDTSLSEEGIVGRAVGMALGGLLPVPEIQFRKYADRTKTADVTPIEREAGLSLQRQWQVLLSTGFGVGLLAAASLATVLRLLL